MTPFEIVCLQQREESRRARARAERRAATIAKMRYINEGNRDLGGGPYSIILADPPWQYRNSSSGSNRAIENQYPTMDTGAIARLPVGRIAEADSVLFLWVPGPILPEGLSIMDAWGFQYRAQAVWKKNKLGMGHWFRALHENVLVGVRGSFPTPQPSIRMRSVFDADYRGHSVKPTIIHEYIEKAYPGMSRIELFCREPRPGWHSFGNESHRGESG